MSGTTLVFDLESNGLLHDVTCIHCLVIYEQETDTTIVYNDQGDAEPLTRGVQRLEDADIIVGHNIYGFDLDVLLHRMKSNKVAQWSKLGRLRLSHMPRSVDGNNGITHFLGQLARGRLVCDTYLAARELIRETSYRLRNLAVTRLNICLLYTSPSPRDLSTSRMPSSA